MRLKTYQGKTMNSVMAQIRAELGEDAVIVSTRTLDNGEIRVTAAEDEVIEDALETMDEDAVEFDSHVFFHGIRDYDHVPSDALDTAIGNVSHSDDVMRILLKHSAPASLQDKILTIMDLQAHTDARECLVHALQHVFSFDPLPTTPYERPIMLVGQPGAGKTVTIAKLAARCVMNGIKPVVITADTVKAGAVEQLAAFTKVLGLPLVKVSNPEQLKRALDDHKKADQILIDCPGLNAFKEEDMKELYAYSRVTPMDLVVAIPGGLDVDEAAEIARAFAVLGAKWLIPTRLDLARRLGSVLNAADQAGLAFAAAGTSAEIADGLIALDAQGLADILWPHNAAEGRV